MLDCLKQVRQGDDGHFQSGVAPAQLLHNIFDPFRVGKLNQNMGQFSGMTKITLGVPDRQIDKEVIRALCRMQDSRDTPGLVFQSGEGNLLTEAPAIGLCQFRSYQ